jgi:hypothetical protein
MGWNGRFEHHMLCVEVAHPQIACTLFHVMKVLKVVGCHDKLDNTNA